MSSLNKFLFLLIGALLLVFVCCVVCGVTAPAPAGDVVESRQYIYDHKTGCCFATLGSHTYGYFTTTSITWVPCSVLGNNDTRCSAQCASSTVAAKEEKAEIVPPDEWQEMLRLVQH